MGAWSQAGAPGTQDGLLGFRGIQATILGVAEAMAKAYPLLVGPALERAKAAAEPQSDDTAVEDAWLREVPSTQHPDQQADESVVCSTQ